VLELLYPERHDIGQVALGLGQRLHEASLLGDLAGLVQKHPDAPDVAVVVGEDR
jgi:hypothetical protein